MVAVILRNLKRTHTAPSRWIAINADNEPVFIQFCFDRLTVHCPYTPEDKHGNRMHGREAFQQYMHSQIMNKENIYSDIRLSYITNEEMLKLTGYRLAEEAANEQSHTL